MAACLHFGCLELNFFINSIFSVKQRQVNERVKDYFSIAYIEFLLNAAILNDVYRFTMSIWSRN